MKPQVLMTGPMMPLIVEQLEAAFQLHRLWEAEDADALIDAVGGEVRGVAAGRVDATMMARLPKLEIISNFGVGYDSIDVVAAAQRGIVVTNTPDVLTDDVADLALGLMLSVCRRIPQADRFVREGRWLEGGFGLTDKLGGRRVGVVGLGRIGKAFARRAEACAMEVVYHGRNAQPDQPYRFYPDLVEMARDCAFLVVIVPGGAGTDGMISRAVLEALGPEGTLVNVARGSVVDEPALVELLAGGGLGAAALDVFADEPRVPQPLLGLDNVVLQPHQGSATHATRRAMAQLVVDNLIEHFAGRPPLTPVPETPPPN